MNKNELIDIFENLTPTPEQKEKMLSGILDNKSGRSRTIKRPVKKLSIIAAVIALCTLTAMAAFAALNTVKNWCEEFIEYFNPSKAAMEQLDNAVTIPEITGTQNGTAVTETQNGLTITIKQTIADAYGMYVLYEMQAPEGVELTDDFEYMFEKFWLKVDAPDGEGGTTDTGGCFERILGHSGNTREVLICYNTTGKIKENQTLELTFENLLRNSDKSYHMFIEGKWNLKWDFHYKDSGITFDVNKMVQFKDINGNYIDTYLTKIYVSPISVAVNFEIDKEKIKIWDGFGRINVNLKDGTIVTCGGNMKNKVGVVNQLEVRNADGNCLKRIGIDQIIDVSEVESISFGDITISIG